MSEMVATGVDKFAAALKGTLAALTTRAADALTPVPRRKVLIAPGQLVAHDDCCKGQVWARLVSLAPIATNDPGRRPGMDACAVPHFLLTGELGIIRCAATQDNSGKAPSARQVTEDGEQSLEDMSGLLGVLRCTKGLRSLGTWSPTGPEGGCHGGFWTFTMLVSNCIGCDEVA